VRLWNRSTPVVTAADPLIAAHQALGWGGFVLPRVQMSGGAIYPVVAWTPEADGRRVAGPEPTMCRPTLLMWEVDGPASAIRIVGFLHAGASADGIDRLRAVAAYGPGAMVTANPSRTDAWTMAEADLAGISVVEACATRGAHVVLRGRDTPLPTARRSVATRLREEQLYGWALYVGAEPADDLRATVCAASADRNL
jgi:hypothetical protein